MAGKTPPDRKTPPDQLSLAELAEWRAVTHRLLSSLFLYPEVERVQGLSTIAREFRDDASDLAGFPFFSALRRVTDFIVSLSEHDAKRIQEEYVDIFQVTTSRPPCPLNESAYLGQDTEDAGRIAAEVERAYAAAGTAISPSATGELPDHVSLELEFMSLICGEEAEAWEANLPQRAAECLRWEKEFLDQHLARWLPRFARRLSRIASEASFYRHLADAARAFVVHDHDLVGALTAADLDFGE